MQPDFKLLTFRIGSEEILAAMSAVKPMVPFSDPVIAFFNALSRKLIQEAGTYPDVLTYAFWCRKASLLEMRKPYPEIDLRIGRGVTFHITPSNIPVNFIFSFSAGLLAGNANIVRLPSNDYPQVQILCEAVRELLAGDFSFLRPYVCFVQYLHNEELTTGLSQLCNTRIIWGGDATISEIRKSPLRSRANEITFGDRYSLAVIDSSQYLKADDKISIAESFYNDTLLNDQNACTSPRAVVWLGKNITEAKQQFWMHFHEIAKKRYLLAPVKAVEKLSQFCRFAASHQCFLEPRQDNLVFRISVPELYSDLMEFKGDCGYFYEYDAEHLEDIVPLLIERCQTLAYFGIKPDMISALMKKYQLRGVDRAVPFGQATNFNLFWDGYDLIRTMSRLVEIGGKEYLC